VLRRALLDTNLYIGWLNGGRHEYLVTGRGFVRYLSGVVAMELEAGATTPRARRALDQLARGYEAAGRLVCPSASDFRTAGSILRGLRSRGQDVRRASLVHDVLLAATARSIGVTLYTRDLDFEAIRTVHDFPLEIVTE